MGASQEVELDVAVLLSYPVGPPSSGVGWSSPGSGLLAPSGQPGRHYEGDDPGDGGVDDLPPLRVLAFHVSPFLRMERVG